MSIQLDEYDDSSTEAKLIKKITKIVKKRNYSLAIEWEMETTGEDDAEHFEDEDFNWQSLRVDNDDNEPYNSTEVPSVSGDGSLRSFNNGELIEVKIGHLQPDNIEEVLKMLSIQAAKCTIPKNWSAGLHFHIGAHDKPMLKRFDMAWNLAHRIYKKFKKEIDMRMNTNLIPGIGDMDWNPSSNWCKLEYQLGEGVYMQHGYNDDSRYRFINFSALRRWGTIEVRSFFSPTNTEDIYIRLYEVVKALDEYETCMCGEIEKEPVMFELNMDLRELEGEVLEDSEFGQITINDGVETDKQLDIKDSMSKAIFDINQRECEQAGDLSVPSDGRRPDYSPTQLNILQPISGVEKKIK